MAIVQYGDIITGMRGHRGGITYSHNRYGDYSKLRKGPPNKRTATQEQRRSNFAYLTRYWTTDLNQPERDAWDTYAADTDFTNPLSDTYHASGFNMFNRTNTLKAMSGQAIEHDAPPAPGHGTLLVVHAELITPSEGANNVSFAEIAFANYDKTVDDDTILIFWSPQVDQSGMYLSPPCVYQGCIIGNALDPPAFPKVIPYAMGNLKRLNWMIFFFSRIMPDGKIASRVRVPSPVGI